MKKYLVVLMFLTQGLNLAWAGEVKISGDVCHVYSVQISNPKQLIVNCEGLGSMATISTENLVEAKALADLLISNDENITVNIMQERKNKTYYAVINIKKN